MCFTTKRTRNHNEHKGRRRRRGRAVRARKAHVRPEGPVGAWRASHAMLWFFGNLAAKPPSYRSYMSYRSYRIVFNKGAARTPVRAKPDGLTPVALRAKRPLIAPSRSSSSRLKERRRGVGQSPSPKTKPPSFQTSSFPFGAGKWGAGGRTTVRPALAPHLSCKSRVFADSPVACEAVRAHLRVFAVVIFGRFVVKMF